MSEEDQGHWAEGPSDDEVDSDDEIESEEEEETAETCKVRGNEHYKQKQYREAIEEYSKAIAIDPTIATLFTNRASAHMMLSQYDDAIRDCDAAIEIDSSLTKAYIRKAKALLGKGNPQEAVSLYTAVLVKDPSNSEAKKGRNDAETVTQRLELARRCLEQKDYSQTWRQIAIIEQHMPAVPSIQMMKVEALCGIGKYNEAYALTTSLMRTNSQLQGLLFWRAKCLYYMDNVPQAIKHMQQAMRSDPDNKVYRDELKRWKLMESMKEAGNAAFKSGKLEEAIEKWTECLAIDPCHRQYNAKLYCNRGTAHAKLRRHDQAAKDCTEAIKLDDTYIKAYNRRAESLRVLGEKENLEQALRDVEKMAELDDENARSYRQKIQQIKVEIKRAGQLDLYKVMGVSKDVTEDELRKAYKKAALKWHPDRHSSKSEEEQQAAASKFQEINLAFEVLSDAEKKQRYDSGVELEDIDDPHGGHHSHGGFSQDDLLRMFMAQHGMGGGMGGGRGGFGGMHFG